MVLVQFSCRDIKFTCAREAWAFVSGMFVFNSTNENIDC